MKSLKKLVVSVIAVGIVAVCASASATVAPAAPKPHIGGCTPLNCQLCQEQGGQCFVLPSGQCGCT